MIELLALILKTHLVSNLRLGFDPVDGWVRGTAGLCPIRDARGKRIGQTKGELKILCRQPRFDVIPSLKFPKSADLLRLKL